VRFLRRPIDDVWLAFAVALPALVALVTAIPTVDVAYLLRTGDLILSSGALPRTDPFTFSAVGHEWVIQQWGAAVAIALTFRAAGWIGLLVLQALLVSATFGLLVFTVRRNGVKPRTASLVTIGSFLVAWPALGIRPQLFGVLLFAATLALLGERHRHPRIVLVLPVVFLAWANLHGTFPVGLVAVGWALLEDLAASRRTATKVAAGRAARLDVVVLLLSFAATFVNPYGVRVWTYAVGIVSSGSVTARVTEWQPPVLASIDGALFYGSLLLVVLLVGARWRRTTWPTRLWLLGLAVAGVWSFRGVVWWALGSVVAIAPLLAAGESVEAASSGVAGTTADLAPGPRPAGDMAPGTSGTPPALPQRRRAINGVLVIGVALMPLILLVPIVSGPTDPLAGPTRIVAFAPSGLAAALREVVKPGDRVFNRQAWGSWFEWAVPDALMFTDSRFEVIPDAAWKDYRAITDGRFDWAQSLDRIGADVIVVERDEQKALFAAIAAAPSSGWHQAYADADGVIFTR
jgi:hypothetical protein